MPHSPHRFHRSTPSARRPMDAARTLSVTADLPAVRSGTQSVAPDTAATVARSSGSRLSCPRPACTWCMLMRNGVARLKLRPQFKLNRRPAHREDQARARLRPAADTRRVVPGCGAQSRARAHVPRAADDHARRRQRETFDEWRNQVALNFLGDPNRRAVVYPAPTAAALPDRDRARRRAFRRQARHRRRSSRCRSKPSGDSTRMSASGTAVAPNSAPTTIAVHAEKQQMMRDWIEAHGSTRSATEASAGVFPFDEYRRRR